MITSHRIAALLNEMLTLDPQATYFLMRAVGPANRALLEHPTIVVKEPCPGQQVVGLLGLLQAVGAMDGHNIVAHYDEKKLVCFEAVLIEELKKRCEAKAAAESSL